MALPKIQYPIYKVYLKSLDKEIRFRPFLVKEEKLILMAKEAEDVDTALDTAKQIIQNCILDQGVDVEDLPLFDIEMMFIHLRLRSVGESLELTYKCENVVDAPTETSDGICGSPMVFEVDLNEVEYIVPEGHTKKIMIDDKIGVMLKYPSITAAKRLSNEGSDFSDIVDLIYEHIDYIFDDGQKYKSEEVPKEEVEDFIGSLSIEQLEYFRNFFMTVPYVRSLKEVTCKKCGFGHKIEVRGLNDFFG